MTDDSQPVGLWNESRREIHELLCGVHPDIAALYRYAIDLVSDAARPGEARTRAALVGHCMRELMNNLPEALNDVEGLPVRGQNSQKASEAVIRVFGTTELSDWDDARSGQSRLVTVPSALIDAVAAFVRDYGAGERRKQLRDAASVLGRLDASDPALKPWTSARSFFMGMTHLDSSPSATSTSNVPPDDAIVRHLEIIEASLLVRRGDFFANLHAIEDLVALANDTSPEGAP